MISTLDIALLSWLQDHSLPWSTPVLQFISTTTTFLSVSIVLIILVISIALKSRPMRMKFIVIAVTLIMVPLVSQGLKYLIDRERPFITYAYIEKLSTGGDSSFPSGHTIEAFALAAAFSCLFPRKKIIIPIYIWALLVAYSRMALGVHYPTDVMAGILIGSFIGWVVPWIFKRNKRMV